MSAGPKPHLWVSGPDPLAHAQYRSFSQQRNQARWRGEPWNLTFQQYQTVWGDQWHRKGRDSDQLCMTRINELGEWGIHNVMLMTRADHNRRESRLRQQRRQRAQSMA